MKKRITKVTTKRGDDGTTMMADGSRVSKSDTLINVIGELDELNSWIGLLSTADVMQEEKDFLFEIQNTLFDIGGRLSIKSNLPIKKNKIEELETKIQNINENLPDLENFILPGGSKESSLIHITRSVCRRTERSMTRVYEAAFFEKNNLVYLNRLSDFLFVLARQVNIKLGEKEFLWSQEEL